MKPKVIRCPACGARRRRSTTANRFYWALLHELSEQVKPEGKAYSSEQWHLYFKSRFLGAEDMVLPNGKTVVVPHSTADLSQDEFGEYVDKVSAWAAGRGVFLEQDA